MGKSVKAQEVPSYQNQLQSNVNAQAAVMPQLLSLEQQYSPQQTALAGQLQNQAFGQGVQSTAQYAPILQDIFNQAQNQAIQGNSLYSTMYNQAQSGLQAGGALSPDEQREATQSGLQGFAQRGMAGSNMGILNSVLNRTNYSNQRYQQRLGNAQSVYGQMPGAVGYTNAANGILGSAMGAANTMSGFGFNPESSMATGIQEYNANSRTSANYANASMHNSILGGVIGGIGNIATGGLFSGLGGGIGTKTPTYQGSSGLFSGKGTMVG